MAKNYNIEPYYDDFNPDKNYHRILFKPGYAVQARELTQSQTIIQNQISNFAEAIYSQNTPVSGGKVTTNLDAKYIKLNPTYNNASVVTSDFLNKKITDSTGTIVATVIVTAEATGNSLQAGDPATLIVSYLSGSQFSDGMTVYITDGETTTPMATTIGTAGGTTSVGDSSTVSVSRGVFWVISGYNTVQNTDGTTTQYRIGNFITCLPQTIVLDKYDKVPSLRAGLNIVEETVTYIDDESLLDPAAGSTNYQAPGADRFKVSLVLETRPLTFGDDDTFIELVRYDAGQTVKQNDNTVYSAIDDYFAKRDYETNGDYIVNDFKLTPVPAANNNSDMYDMIISKGVAYVSGYRVENQSNYTLTVPRARTLSSVAAGANNTFINYGSYFTVDYANGNFNTSEFPQVDIHCVPGQTINLTSIASYNSTKVGTAFLRGLEYVYNTNASNTKSYVFNAFVNDVVTNSLSSNAAATGSTPTSIKFYDPSGNFSAAANAYYGATLRIVSGTSTGDVRTIINYDATNKIANVDSTFTVTPDSTSYFNLILGTTNANSIVRAANTGGTGTSGDPAKKLIANTNINISSGKLNGVPFGPTIFNSSGTPEMIFPLGNQYVANNSIGDTRFYSTQIWRDKTFSAVSNSFTISSTAPIYFEGTTGQTYYGDSFKSLFTVIDSTTGQILPFDTGANTASVNTSTSVTFSSAAYSAIAHPVTVIASVYASISGTGDSTGNILKTKSKITGNTTAVGTLSAISNSAGTGKTNAFQDISYGQTYLAANAFSTTASMSLYVSDGIKITKVVDTGTTTLPSAGALLSGYTDITSSFDFDDGQKDNFYDHASVRLKAGAAKPSGNILVVYDYYSHSGGDGYFTVSSYLGEDYRKIPSYTAKNGNIYYLRDCVDFRPTRQNGVTTYTWDYKTPPSATPGNSGGIFFPQNKSDFISGYNFYLGRKDKLVLTKDSKFLMITGTSSKNPQYPIEPDGSLLLAQIDLDPYTSYVPGEGINYVSAESTYGVTSVSEPSNLSVTKILHKRWAKSDITDLQTQVNNLEYYTALSILESNANALQIPDVNGLNRFKNGILVDDFSSFATAETYSQDYSANINIRKKTLGPVTWVRNFPLQNPEVLGSYGTSQQPINTFKVNSINGLSHLFTLPYSTFNIAVQQLGSGTISVNPFGVVNYEGSCVLNPPIDNWVNTNEVPSVLIKDPRYQFSQETGGVNLTNAGDYASLAGTTQLYDPQAATQTTQSYISQTVGINTAMGTSSAAATPLTAQNGYITNEGVKAYIRPQEVIVRAKGLLVNSPLSCWFDGLNVDKYMTAPDIVELYGVGGKFKEDDIVGFYDNVYTFSFYPIGRVASVYNYPTNNQTRLYISEYIQTPTTIATANLTNAYFAANGQYLYSSAYGKVTFPAGSNSIISLTSSGTVTGPGITFTPSGNSSAVQSIYKSQKLWGTTEAGTLLNNYGVWGNNSFFGTTYNGGAFRVPVTANGTYTLKVVSTGPGSVSFGNSSGIMSPTGSPTTVLTATKNISGNAAFLANTLIQWNITASSTSNASFAAIVYNSNNEVIWNTLSPVDLKFDGSSANIAGPDGGVYYSGLTTVALSKDSPAISNFYVGGEITIKSTYTYAYNYTATYRPPPPQVAVSTGRRSGDGDPGQPIIYTYVDDTAAINAQTALQNAERNQNAIMSQTYTFTANIIGYNAATKVATLDKTVDIAMGTSALYGNLNSKYSIRGTVGSVAEAKRLGNTIPQLSSNENGEFVGVFSIPGSQFFTGERVFRIDNRNRATNRPDSATTFAEATFYAGGIFGVNTLSPSVDSGAGTFTRQSKQGYNIVSIQNTMDPLAQSFILDKKNYPNGAFLNSVKLFFAPYQNNSKPTTPVTISIVETLNGYPTGKILDYSKVIVDAQNVKTSNVPHYLNPDTYTEFVFSAPVYVQSGVLYAILIQAGSIDYLVYYGGQNEPAITSTAKVNYTDADPTKPTKIGATPYVGSLFESQNSITWSADQGKSLMFVLSACRFDTTVKPTVNFVVPKNLPNRKLPSQALSYAMNANVVQNLYGTYTQTPLGVHAINLTTTDFTPTGTGIDYTYATTLESTRAKTSSVGITPGRYASPLSDEIYLNDGKGPRVLLPESNSSFEMTATMSSTDPYVSPVISDDGTTLYTVNYGINNMGIQTAQIQVANGGSGYTNSATIIITSGLTGSNSTNDLGITDLPVFGYTTNAISGEIQTVFTSYRGSGYLVNPTITVREDATRSGNSNASIVVISEQSPTGGNGRARYLTKKVVLTPSNESGDLRVYYSAYKPFGSEVYVYYRILNSNDNDILENQQWQLMTQVGRKDIYSLDRNDIIEFETAPGYFTSLQPNNAISYTSTANTVYTSFNQFQVKVVMSASDPTNPPILTDIRAIALPPGTGI